MNVSFPYRWDGPSIIQRMPIYRIPTSLRGKWYYGNYGQLSNQRLATDAIGTFTLELRGIVSGSRYRVEVVSTGTLVAEGTAASTTVTISNLDYYGPGSANNNLRIKVRKGTSGTKYFPFETQAEAQAGTVVSYIAQTVDTIVS